MPLYWALYNVDIFKAACIQTINLTSSVKKWFTWRIENVASLFRSLLFVCWWANVQGRCAFAYGHFLFFIIMAISLPTCSVLLLFSISYTVWISFDLFTAFENHFHLRLLQRNSAPKWQMKCKRLMWIHNIVIYRVCIICITDTNIIEAVISKRQYSFINSPIWIFIPFSTDLKILMLLAILWTMAINLYVCVLALLWNSLKCAILLVHVSIMMIRV